MNIALTVPLADTWGMHTGGWWLLLAIPMMLFMGVMMWIMMRRMMGHDSSKHSSTRSDTSVNGETPTDILERRFAHGELSVEEYRERRQALAEVATKSGVDEHDQMAGSRAGKG